MYLLYPRLPLAIAEKIAQGYVSQSVDQLLNLSTCSHISAEFAPTGGNMVKPNELAQIQQQVRDCAKLYGYPNFVNDDTSRQFDTACGILLSQEMFLHPSEASHLGVWVFITCVLLPDVVRWRFPGDSTSIERFIGSDRGLRRNTFGRLWWRAYLLAEASWEDPYLLLRELVEDDLVQITERNSIAASQQLSIAFSTAFLQAIRRYDQIPRRMLMREASKRVRRLLSIISFDALEPTIVSGLIDDVFEKTAKSLIASHIDQ